MAVQRGLDAAMDRAALERDVFEIKTISTIRNYLKKLINDGFQDRDLDEFLNYLNLNRESISVTTEFVVEQAIFYDVKIAAEGGNESTQRLAGELLDYLAENDFTDVSIQEFLEFCEKYSVKDADDMDQESLNLNDLTENGRNFIKKFKKGIIKYPNSRSLYKLAKLELVSNPNNYLRVTRLLSVLIRYHIIVNGIEDLCGYTEEEILSKTGHSNFGEKSLDFLKEIMKELGLRLKDQMVEQ